MFKTVYNLKSICSNPTPCIDKSFLRKIECVKSCLTLPTSYNRIVINHIINQDIKKQISLKNLLVIRPMENTYEAKTSLIKTTSVEKVKAVHRRYKKTSPNNNPII